MQAHFFWKGILTDYQLASMLSFRNCGFDVVLWSPEPQDVEKYGIELRNSEEIVPYSIMNNITQRNFHNKDQSGEYEKVAAYSDIFRLKLLKQHSGLWVDCDVFCLKPVEDWLKVYNTAGDVFAGEMYIDGNTIINTGVLGYKNTQVATEISNLSEAIINSGGIVEWGYLGPSHIHGYMVRHNIPPLAEYILYPIRFREWLLSFSTKPEDVAHCLSACQDSLAIHWWNDALDFNGIRQLPKPNSYLGQLFSTIKEIDISGETYSTPVTPTTIADKVDKLKAHKNRIIDRRIQQTQSDLDPDNFFLKKGYVSNTVIKYFDDTELTDEWQNEVYECAYNLFIENNYTRVLDLGTGSGFKLMKYFSKFDTLGIDLPETVNFLKTTYPDRNWSDSFTPVTGYDLLICSDVLEHLLNPDDGINFIKAANPKLIVLSTPDRDLILNNNECDGPPRNPSHCREWNFREFHHYIDQHFNIISHALTSEKNRTQTIIAQGIKKQ